MAGDTEGQASYGDPGQEVGLAGPAFVSALANVLTHLASLAGRPQQVTRFHAVRAPQLSIREYLLRIATYFQCSNECFVLGLIYIDRIVKIQPEFTISLLNIHRLLATSVMLAAKFFDDVYYSNAYYAKVGGVRTQELNALEAQFLRLIDFKLHVLPEEYDQYRNHVLVAVQGEATSLALYQQPSSDDSPWRKGEHDSGSAPSTQVTAPATAVPTNGSTPANGDIHVATASSSGAAAGRDVEGSSRLAAPGAGTVAAPAAAAGGYPAAYGKNNNSVLVQEVGSSMATGGRPAVVPCSTDANGAKNSVVQEDEACPKA